MSCSKMVASKTPSTWVPDLLQNLSISSPRDYRLQSELRDHAGDPRVADGVKLFDYVDVPDELADEDGCSTGRVPMTSLVEYLAA